MRATVRLDHTLLAVEGEHDVHAMIEIAAPEPPDAARRPAVHLSIVLDRSGSMSGRKLAIVKRCVAWLLGRLRPDDEVALIDFDDTVRMLTPLVPVASGSQRQALAGVRAGGSTNLSGGWLKGVEELRARGVGGHVLLLTDGLANVGVRGREVLAGLAKQAAEAGVRTSTIGVGDGFDEDLLLAMADAGGGNAHYAETPDAAPRIFAQELEGLTTVAAQNVSLEIRPCEPAVALAVLNDYPSVAVPGGIQVQLGDAYGGERRRVVFKLHVPSLAEAGVVQVADAILRYVAVGDSISQHELALPVIVNAVSAEEAAAAAPDPEVREEVLVLRAASARDEAVRLADRGEYDPARRLMAATVDELRRAGLAEEASELDEVAPAMDPRTYSPMLRKQLRYGSNVRRKGRRPSTPSGEPEEAA